LPLIAYKPKRFNDTSCEMISKINEVISTYQEQGFDLTLRQVYYQMVARGIIPNTDSEYKKLGCLISDARLAGLIDWYSIEDRTRGLRGNTHWNSPGDIIAAASNQYAIDKWTDQGYYVEVWVEKDALSGIVSSACEPLDVNYFSCRGYVSQSEMWLAAQRFMDRAVTYGQKCVILHLGDHDPSGIDMSRDIEARIRLFWTHHYLSDAATDPDESFIFHRIALNWDQIQRYTPPPNPTKLSDSRALSYLQQFGSQCWELDALEPSVIVQLISMHVNLRCDRKLFTRQKQKEADERDALTSVSANWPTVVARLEKGGD